MKKIMLLGLAAAALLSGCSKDPFEPQGESGFTKFLRMGTGAPSHSYIDNTNNR